MEIRESAEDYLERILMLNKSMGQVRAVDIANLMNLLQAECQHCAEKAAAERLCEY